MGCDTTVLRQMAWVYLIAYGAKARFRYQLVMGDSDDDMTHDLCELCDFVFMFTVLSVSMVPIRLRGATARDLPKFSRSAESALRTLILREIWRVNINS